jgi:septal ring factor EnvC (AmiA/AmiB activator)
MSYGDAATVFASPQWVAQLVRVLCRQVAAEALVATESELRAKLQSADEEIAEKRQLLADLKARYDVVAAELAGAEANLASADALLSTAKAHLALKQSLLFEKEALIAALKKQLSAGPAKSHAQPRFWTSLARFRRDRGAAPEQKPATPRS